MTEFWVGLAAKFYVIGSAIGSVLAVIALGLIACIYIRDKLNKR